MASASETIRSAVLDWPGVRSGPHQFGAVEFTIGGREIGHLHGNTLLDVPFPRAVREELVAAGLAAPHRFLPDSGWVSFRIRHADDVKAAIALLRRSYDLITMQLERRAVQNAAAKARV
ncbi:MAG TPA: luciferase family protein [Bauldia sp.]|nr:luciferase family protein [Bauldia sp.]